MPADADLSSSLRGPEPPGAVVLGASGFIGTRLVRHLHATRTGPIRALDILPPRERLQGVDYHIADIREPLDPGLGAGETQRALHICL